MSYENLQSIISQLKELDANELKELKNVISDYDLGQEKVVDEVTIRNILVKQLAIKPSHGGYVYLTDAISAILNEGYRIRGITKILYPKIAEMRNTNLIGIERAIRHAIGASWNNISEENRDVIFHGGLTQRPSNSEYIGYVIDYIQTTELTENNNLNNNNTEKVACKKLSK